MEGGVNRGQHADVSLWLASPSRVHNSFTFLKTSTDGSCRAYPLLWCVASVEVVGPHGHVDHEGHTQDRVHAARVR